MSEQSDMQDNAKETQSSAPQMNIWKRGLFMIIFAILFGIAESLLVLGALVQFLWMLFSGKRNEMIADVGRDLGVWMQDVVAFQTANTNVKPFPWDKSAQ